MRFSFLSEEIKSLKYYGSGDLAGGIFVKNVVDSLEVLESHVPQSHFAVHFLPQKPISCDINEKYKI